MKKIAGLLTVLLVLISSVLYASQTSLDPIDTVRKYIEEVLSILDNPEYGDEAHRDIKNEKIWDIIQDAFDFSVIAKRALGRKRRDFTPRQLDEFTDVFSKLLKNTYIGQLDAEGKYKNVAVEYLGQKLFSDVKAVVMTNVIRDNIKTPIEYSMLMRKDAWRVYDVKVEKVSLVRNYRSQFTESRDTPDQLIHRLWEKVNSQQAADH